MVVDPGKLEEGECSSEDELGGYNPIPRPSIDTSRREVQQQKKYSKFNHVLGGIGVSNLATICFFVCVYSFRLYKELKFFSKYNL